MVSATTRRGSARSGPGFAGFFFTLLLMVCAFYLGRIADELLPDATDARLIGLPTLVPLTVALGLLIPTKLSARIWHLTGGGGYLFVFLAVFASLGAGLYVADAFAGGGLILIVAYGILGTLGSLGSTAMLRLYRCGACQRRRRIYLRGPLRCGGAFPHLERSECASEKPQFICRACTARHDAPCCEACMARFRCHHDAGCDLRRSPACRGLDEANPCGDPDGPLKVCSRHDSKAPGGRGHICGHCERVHTLRNSERRPVEDPRIACQVCDRVGTPSDPVVYCHSRACRSVAHRRCFEKDGRWCSFARCELNEETWVLPAPERRAALAAGRRRCHTLARETELLKQSLTGLGGES